MTYKEHHSTSFFDESVSDGAERYTGRCDAMDKQHFPSIFRTPFIDSNCPILPQSADSPNAENLNPAVIIPNPSPSKPTSFLKFEKSRST
jgi:hypothetical protein